MAIDLGFEMVDVDSQFIGVDEAMARLAYMEHALDDMREPIEGMVGDIFDQTSSQFASLGIEAGTPWEPLEESTIANKVRMGYPAPGWPLVATGELRLSATSQHGEWGTEAAVQEMEAELALDWEKDGYNIAALHQEGVPWRLVHRKAYTTREGTPVRATSYMWHLPARPMWLATDRLMDEGADRIVAHVFNPLA